MSHKHRDAHVQAQAKKQPKTARDESQNIHPEFIGAIKRILDEKLDELTTRLTSMMDQRIAELEKKFQAVQRQISDLKR